MTAMMQDEGKDGALGMEGCSPSCHRELLLHKDMLTLWKVRGVYDKAI